MGWLGWVQIFPLIVGWVGQLMGRVGSGHTKWIRGQLWVSPWSVIEGSFSARLTAETVQSNYSVDCRLTDAFVASNFINTLKNSWRAATG